MSQDSHPIDPPEHATPESPELSLKGQGDKARAQVKAGRKRFRKGLARVRLPRPKRSRPGTPGGIEYHELARTASDVPPRILCTDFSLEQVQAREVQDIAAFLAVHRPAWSKVRWIHVEGLKDQSVIRSIAEKYQLHPLAIEDILDKDHRPKLEDYPETGGQPGRLFVMTQALRLVDGQIAAESIAFFLGRTTLLSFEHSACAAIEEIRHRIESPRSRVRQNDASFLLYALIDAVVDRSFPILDACSQRLEDAEDAVLTRPETQSLHDLHLIKRDLVMIRRTAWPMRELVAHLQRDRHECLSDIAQTYFRDVYDHCAQIIDLIETYREIANAVTETYVSVVSNRTNDIMKVLTVIGTIFIPLTFLAGVYGMNLEMPETHWPPAYPLFWVVCLVIALVMLWRFKRGGWL